MKKMALHVDDVLIDFLRACTHNIDRGAQELKTERKQVSDVHVDVSFRLPIQSNNRTIG